jgi:hypothetical protein
MPDIADNLGSEEKIQKLKDAGVQEGTWKDLVCGGCHRRCCSPCTADGDWHHCSKTMLANCAVCHHASTEHYTAPH